MANVGKLTVSLTTLTGKFGEGFREAGKHLHEFGAKAHELGAKLAETGKKMLEFAGIAEALSFGGIAYLTHEAAEAIEKNAHLADQLGTTTEALLGMQYAAKEAGVGADEFAQSMRHLEKDLGNPSKEVNDALGKIRLTAIGLMNQDPETQFKRIADGVSHLGTQAEKAAVAYALFGRQGVQLLSVLDEGSRGVDENIEKVRKLGAAFSRVDAQQVIEANHALEAMHLTFDSIFTKLAEKFAPFITEASEHLLSLGKDGTSVADAIGNSFVDAVRHMLRLVDAIDLAKAAFYGLGGGVHSAAELAFKGVAKIANVFADVDEFAAKHSGPVGKALFGDSFDQSAQLGRNIAAGATISAGDSGNLAKLALDHASELLRSAMDGDRSMTWQKTFDDIIARAHQRAVDKVGKAGAARAANTAEERKRLGEQVAKGFADALKRSKAFIGNKLDAARGAQLITGDLQHFLAFMKTLPMRALKAGWRPPVDLQTQVRGSFSGETAGRMSAAYSIQEKQLEESKKQTEIWRNLLLQFQAGVPAP